MRLVYSHEAQFRNRRTAQVRTFRVQAASYRHHHSEFSFVVTVSDSFSLVLVLDPLAAASLLSFSALKT